jgi:hypothetical protein
MKNTTQNSLSFTQILRSYAIPVSVTNGLLYFTVAIAGSINLQNIFKFINSPLMIFVSLGAAICYGMFTYKSLEHLNLRPKKWLSWVLALLAPFAASSFLTAGIEGAAKLHIFNLQTVVAIGVVLFFMRTINFIDGAVKFPHRLQEMKVTFLNALKRRDYKNLLCILIVVYTTIGYCLSTTDSIYTASVKVSGWLGVTSEYLLSSIGYTSSAIGAIVGIPMIFYWTQRGVTQLLKLGIPDKNNIIHDPTDIYTYLGLVATLPVILGCLGAATSSSAHVFGQLGIFSDVIRLSSSILFAICGGVPGLSTLLRSVTYFRNHLTESST